MRYPILAALFFVINIVNAQIKVPKNFYLVKGESNAGRDDYYTDGQYTLSEGNPFQAEHLSTDEDIMILLTGLYGLSFDKTKEGFYYGSGHTSNKFKYVVVAKEYSYILTSKIHNKGFSNYAKWLLNKIKFCVFEGDKAIYFKS